MIERRPARAAPDRATLLRRLRKPELDLAEADDDDIRRIELRRVVLEVAGLDHAGEIALVTAAAARLRKGEAQP